MGSMADPTEEIKHLFSSSQQTAACHQKNSLILRNVYEKSNFAKFWEPLKCRIDTVLTTDHKQKNPFAERIIEFVGIFCEAVKRKTPHEDDHTENDEDTEEPLIENIFSHLLKDSKEIIRLQGIVSLWRLQNPQDPDDELIHSFLQLMHDNKAKVRQLAVEKIALRADVIRYIFQRAQDVDENVKVTAYTRLARCPKIIKIVDRRMLLHGALWGGSQKVKDLFFTHFLSSWLDVYDNRILDLMKCFRLDSDEKDIRGTLKMYESILNLFFFKNRTIKEIYEVLPLNEEKLMPYHQLNWETVSYWRFLIELFSKNSDLDNHLENVVPEVVFFCRYVKGYSEYSTATTNEDYLKKQFILKQLFHILSISEIADPHSEQSVNSLVEYLLKKEDLLDDTLEIIIGILEKTFRDPDKRCRFGMEIISDLLCPVNDEEEARKFKEREFQLSKLKVHFETLQNDQVAAIASKDYIEAERLKHVLEDVSFQISNLQNAIFEPAQEALEKNQDIPTICKCLDIAWAILRNAGTPKLTPTLTSLNNEFIPEYLIYPNEIVKLKALRCYAICCIYDKSTARQGIHIFAAQIMAYQAGEECDSQTLITCISTLSDLLRIYGSDLMAEPNENLMSDSVNEEHETVFTGGTSLTLLFQGLVDLMDNEQYEIQLKACEGLCKIVLEERIHSSKLISRLILKWCNPINNDEPEGRCLKQFVGNCLEKLPLLSCTKQLEEAVVLTLNTLVKVPKNSPLADVDIDNIAKFMVSLCKVSKEGQTMHCNIASNLCSEINKHPDAKVNNIFSKMLLTLDLSEDQSFIEKVFASIDEAREYITEKSTLKNLTKFLSRLDEILRGNKDMTVIEEEEVEEDDD